MATLPSPKPERYSAVHVLRRERDDWEKYLEKGAADAETYAALAAEREQKAERMLAEKTGLGPVYGHVEAARRWRLLESQARTREDREAAQTLTAMRGSRRLWQGIALVLLGGIILMAMAARSKHTRPLEWEEQEWRAR